MSDVDSRQVVASRWVAGILGRTHSKSSLVINDILQLCYVLNESILSVRYTVYAGAL